MANVPDILTVERRILDNRYNLMKPRLSHHQVLAFAAIGRFCNNTMRLSETLGIVNAFQEQGTQAFHAQSAHLVQLWGNTHGRAMMRVATAATRGREDALRVLKATDCTAEDAAQQLESGLGVSRADAECIAEWQRSVMAQQAVITVLACWRRVLAEAATILRDLTQPGSIVAGLEQTLANIAARRAGRAPQHSVHGVQEQQMHPENIGLLQEAPVLSSADNATELPLTLEDAADDADSNAKQHRLAQHAQRQTSSSAGSVVSSDTTVLCLRSGKRQRCEDVESGDEDVSLQRPRAERSTPAAGACTWQCAPCT